VTVFILLLPSVYRFCPCQVRPSALLIRAVCMTYFSIISQLTYLSSIFRSQSYCMARAIIHHFLLSVLDLCPITAQFVLSYSFRKALRCHITSLIYTSLNWYCTLHNFLACLCVFQYKVCIQHTRPTRLTPSRSSLL